ncbi:hypothetical protein [Nocardiopsis aegyptia]|uniref:Uncharacterized protein n=1 Tax=Nocardiopsis aegyptia TaxID=220378 RepID=A0A7Z0ELA2_9ACTN|nr:hypothetical protein [Nocardiopsis aegyptia]NYJ34178.1 hypothetical protein [Nocardiopsis aegyptia]
MTRTAQVLPLLLCGVPYALGLALVPTVLSWSLDALFPSGDGIGRDLALLAGAVVCVSAGLLLLTALLRGSGVTRPTTAAGFLTAAAVAAWIQTAVTDHVAPVVPWSVGTWVAAALTAAVVAVVLAATDGRRPWILVCVLVGLLLLRAGAEGVIGAQIHDRTLRATEATYAAYPHDIAVLDDPAWEAVGTRLTEAGHAFTITYEDGSGRRVVLTSAPAEFFLGGRPDPLRYGCDAGSTTCEESRGVVLLASDSDGTDAPDLARTELASGFYAELATAPLAPDELLSADELLLLSDRIEVDEDGDREALARDVMAHHDW